MKNRIHISTIAVTLLLLLAGCSSTPKVENNWTAPEIGSIEFDKVMVVAATPDGALRRNAEMALRMVIPESVETVASHEVITSAEDMKSASVILREAKNTNADGIVVIRPLGQSTEIDYMPSMAYPSSYWSFGGYYQPTWGLSAYYEPGYITTDTVVGLETNIYEVETGNLIWSGATQIRNPDDVKDLIETNAQAVLNKMREQQLIQ